MFLLNNVKVHQDIQRTIGDVQYPAGWFSNAEARAAVGMIEVPDPVRPDDSLFTYVENLDGSYTVTPRTDAEIAAYKTAKDTEQAKSIRTDRTKRLVDSDWTQLADAPVDKEVWATYRTALRNITKADGFPWTMVWPEQP
jgi:hypothetical protein